MVTGSVGLDGSFVYRIDRPTGDELGDVRNRALGLAVGFSAFAF